MVVIPAKDADRKQREAGLSGRSDGTERHCRQEDRQFHYSDRQERKPGLPILAQAQHGHRGNSGYNATFSPMQFPLVLPLKYRAISVKEYKAISPKAKAIAGTGSTDLLSSTGIVF